MNIQLASDWDKQKNRTVLLAGPPKGAGKTTFALSFPTPILVQSFDLGLLSIPPGVDPTQVAVVAYHDVTRSLGEDGKSHPKQDLYAKLLRDLQVAYDSVKSGKGIKLPDGSEFPPPRTLVADGLSRLDTMLVDGQCALQGVAYPEDIPDKQRFGFWGRRLRDVLTATQQFASLDCNVALTSWVGERMDKDGKPTGVWYPDIGGKMDILGAGIVGAALYCYGRGGRYYVRTKADGIYPWVGVRGNYDAVNEIDVTIEPGKPLPFERVFGKVGT